MICHKNAVGIKVASNLFCRQTLNNASFVQIMARRKQHLLINPVSSRPFFWRIFPNSEEKANKRALFFHTNQIEVRALYRDLLKSISRVLPRKLEREVKLAELRFMFRESAKETDPDQINEIKMVFYTILARIEHGVYPPFPDETFI